MNEFQSLTLLRASSDKHSHLLWVMLLLILGLCSDLGAAELPPIRTVFLIMMENKTWAAIKGNPSAPFINHTLIPNASVCTQYRNLLNLHPSLPNYLWLEAGTNFGIQYNGDPDIAHQNTTNHLSTYLNAAGISWKAYQEHISSTNLSLVSTPLISCRHNPFLYFDDVTGTNNPNDPYGIAHIRPFDEFFRDLTDNEVARYNFLIPDDYNDMHTELPPAYDMIQQGDSWLANVVPSILASQAFTNNGALFIAFDETDSYDDFIPLIVISPFAKGDGYESKLSYNHSSLLRTIQEIFGITPLLGDATNATNLADLFGPPVLKLKHIEKSAQGMMCLTISGAKPGVTHFVQASGDLSTWSDIWSNAAPSISFTVCDTNSTTLSHRFYRVLQLP
jgi:phospholipase C